MISLHFLTFFPCSLRSRPTLCECLHSSFQLDPVLEEERRDSLLPNTSVLIPPREAGRREGEEGELREEEMDEVKEEDREEKEEAGLAENKEEN